MNRSPIVFCLTTRTFIPTMYCEHGIPTTFFFLSWELRETRISDGFRRAPKWFSLMSTRTRASAMFSFWSRAREHAHSRNGGATGTRVFQPCFLLEQSYAAHSSNGFLSEATRTRALATVSFCVKSSPQINVTVYNAFVLKNRINYIF